MKLAWTAVGTAALSGVARTALAQGPQAPATTSVLIEQLRYQFAWHHSKAPE